MQRQKTARKDPHHVTETGGFRKKWTNRLPIALVFPNTYRLGMSNLGFQLVYAQLNAHPDIVCERVFLPEGHGAPRSIESGRPLRDFPLVFCSVSFENDFPALIRILGSGGIEPLAAARADGSPAVAPGAPLVVVGGVAASINPEPLAPFVDLFAVGESEALLPEVLPLLREAPGADRRELLRRIATGLPGWYAPCFYTPRYDRQGLFAGYEVEPGLPPRVVRRVLADAAEAGHSQLLTPAAEFADLFLAELGRGCSRGCRFCAAGFVYRPPRLWSAEAIERALAARPAGCDRIGLLGMEMARPADVARLAEALGQSHCRLSFSSLRADVLGPELLALFGKSRLKSVAIAPDGASERLRRLINKNITESDVLTAGERLADSGITNIKLYVMIGLPTETEADLDEFAALVDRLRQRLLAVGRRQGRVADLTLSVNCFVPKAWTPLEFHAMAPLGVLRQRLKGLRQRLARTPNLKIIADHPEHALFQAMLARGDRRLAGLLEAIAATGRNWRQLAREQGIDPEFYACRQRGEDEAFPWEVVDHGIRRVYLWAEYRRALKEKSTVPCEPARCRRCGVCHGQ